MVVLFAMLNRVPADACLVEETLEKVEDLESHLIDLYVSNDLTYVVDGLREQIKHAPNSMEKLFYQVGSQIHV